MKSSRKDYLIKFNGLSLGDHQFSFKIGDSFFKNFGFDSDFENSKFDIQVNLIKSVNLLQFNFKLAAEIDVLCDLSGEEFRQKFNDESSLIVKFGEEADTTDDEVWVLPQKEHEIDLSQFFYEFIILSLPKKRVHPDYVEEEENEEIINFDSENSNDPRWDALKKLKLDI